MISCMKLRIKQLVNSIQSIVGSSYFIPHANSTKINDYSCISCRVFVKFRPVVPGCAGCAMAHPDFGRSLNSISSRGTDYNQLKTTGTPGFSDLPTALYYAHCTGCITPCF